MQNLNIKQIIEDLKHLRDDDSKITLTFNPSTIWILIFEIQMAMRYPSIAQELAKEAYNLAKEMQASLDGHPLYTESLRQALDLDWDYDFDDNVNNRTQQSNNN